MRWFRHLYFRPWYAAITAIINEPLLWYAVLKDINVLPWVIGLHVFWIFYTLIFNTYINRNGLRNDICGCKKSRRSITPQGHLRGKKLTRLQETIITTAILILSLATVQAVSSFSSSRIWNICLDILRCPLYTINYCWHS